MKIVDKIKNNKLLFFLGVLIVGIIVVLIIRFTYAYFAAQVNEARGNVSIDSDTTDNLSFEIGDPLSIVATPTTLPENGGNLTSTTTSKATLLANSTNNTAEYSYYVYFKISNNTFIYSDGSTPEIILTITNPDGSEVTNIEGLTYGTYNGVSGFDVTTKSGTFTVASDYAIIANSSVTPEEQNWTFTLTYLNLNFDQSANFGNSMTTEISMSKGESVTLANYIIEEVYTSDGENGLYYHDGAGSYTNADQEAGDNSYRYSGANPNNYVCFGSDEVTCSTDNLYRIIGVFDGQVKLIKSDYAGESVLGTAPASSVNPSSTYKGSLSSIPYYYWSGSSSNQSNVWSSSTLNTSVLNGTYLTMLGSEWSDLIANHTWQVGGGSSNDLYSGTPQTAYSSEVGANRANTTYQAKIGLMYVSDYGYAASPENWNTTLSNYNNDTNRNNNWMYMGASEWTMSRRSDGAGSAFLVVNTGGLGDDRVNYSYAVRPSFYLESSVVLEGGSGTSTDPYRI